MKKHRCKTPHIISSDNKTVNIKCPWCGTINSTVCSKSINCWGESSEITGWNAQCFYCKKCFKWDKDIGVFKIS